MKKDLIVKFLREYAYGNSKKIEKSSIKALELSPTVVRSGENCGGLDKGFCYILVLDKNN